MASIFSANLQEKIKHYLGRYETKRSAILPILHAIQDECGWIKDEHVDALESDYELHNIHVREVLTFYSAYRRHEPKKFTIQFCDNIVCCMMGAKGVIAKIEQHIAAYESGGKETPFSVQGVPCLGVCDGAPAMLVNKDRHLRVNQDNVDAILQKYAPLAKN